MRTTCEFEFVMRALALFGNTAGQLLLMVSFAGASDLQFGDAWRSLPVVAGSQCKHLHRLLDAFWWIVDGRSSPVAAGSE